MSNIVKCPDKIDYSEGGSVLPPNRYEHVVRFLDGPWSGQERKLPPGHKKPPNVWPEELTTPIQPKLVINEAGLHEKIDIEKVAPTKKKRYHLRIIQHNGNTDFAGNPVGTYIKTALYVLTDSAKDNGYIHGTMKAKKTNSTQEHTDEMILATEALKKYQEELATLTWDAPKWGEKL